MLCTGIRTDMLRTDMQTDIRTGMHTDRPRKAIRTDMLVTGICTEMREGIGVTDTDLRFRFLGSTFEAPRCQARSSQARLGRQGLQHVSIHLYASLYKSLHTC